MAENLYPVHETFREYQIEKALLLAHNSPLRLEAEDPLSLFKLAVTTPIEPPTRNIDCVSLGYRAHESLGLDLTVLQTGYQV